MKTNVDLNAEASLFEKILGRNWALLVHILQKLLHDRIATFFCLCKKNGASHFRIRFLSAVRAIMVKYLIKMKSRSLESRRTRTNNLFMTSKNETTNSPIYQFRNLKCCKMSLKRKSKARNV